MDIDSVCVGTAPAPPLVAVWVLALFSCLCSVGGLGPSRDIIVLYTVSWPIAGHSVICPIL